MTFIIGKTKIDAFRSKTMTDFLTFAVYVSTKVADLIMSHYLIVALAFVPCFKHTTNS